MSDFEERLRREIRHAAERYEPSASLGGRIDAAVRRVRRAGGEAAEDGRRSPWRSGAWAWMTAVAAVVVLAIVIPAVELSGSNHASPTHPPVTPTSSHGSTPTTGGPPTTVGGGPTTSTPATPPTTTTVNPGLPAGGPVPSGFQPASVTFVSASTGYVLGTHPTAGIGAGAGPSCAGGCLALLRTEDGGSNWTGVGNVDASYAPGGAVSQGGQGAGETVYATKVGEVRFADPRDGWVFGPGLLATHDGGASWHAVDLGGAVVSLEAAGGWVEAVVSPCSGVTECSGSLLLDQAPVGGGSFHTVVTGPAVSSDGLVNQDLTLHPPGGFAVLGTHSPLQSADIYATARLGTGGWNSFPDPCAGTSAGGSPLMLSGLVAPNTTQLFSLCSGNGAAGSTTKEVVVTDGGHSRVVGSTPLGGDPSGIAATSNGTIVVGAASGASWLYCSTDGGRTWTSDQFQTGGMLFYDLGFTTGTQGVAVLGHPATPGRGGPSSLLMTYDGGATWQTITL